MTSGDQMIVGTLLENGEFLAAGVGIIHATGDGTFQVTELLLLPNADADHAIRDLYGSLWPVSDVCAEKNATVDPHYNFTHSIDFAGFAATA